MQNQKTSGQGALEYLLLISTGVVVVTIVISFIITTMGPVQSAGNKNQYDFICITLDTNTYFCGCYLCDPKKMGINDATGEFGAPSYTGCAALAKEKSEPLLGLCANLPN